MPNKNAPLALRWTAICAAAYFLSTSLSFGAAKQITNEDGDEADVALYIKHMGGHKRSSTRPSLNLSSPYTMPPVPQTAPDLPRPTVPLVVSAPPETTNIPSPATVPTPGSDPDPRLTTPGPAPDIIRPPSNGYITDPPSVTVTIPNPVEPTDNGATPDGKQIGLQALNDAIVSQGLAASLIRDNIAVLFQDGDVKIDAYGNMHQFADTVSKDGANLLTFINANMLSGQPSSLNWQTTSITFNQPLPGDYTQATRTAFSTLDATLPTYWATDVATTRANSLDTFNVSAGGGTPVLSQDASHFFTSFSNQQASINNVVLYQQTGSNVTYLGGSAPIVEIVNGTGAQTVVRNTYADGTVVERNVTFVDGNGNVASSQNLADGQPALDFVNGLYVHDSIFSAQLMNRPITTFGSSQSRILAGLDSIRTDGEAQNALQGGVVQGAPDGLVHN